MAGTSQGSVSAARTNKQRDPDHYKNIGRKGGLAKVRKGYSMAPEEVRVENGRKGGQTARKKADNAMLAKQLNEEADL